MPTYRDLLLEAMKERKHKKNQLNYADKDFQESIIYEIRALDSRIEALKKRVEVEEHEKNKMGKSGQNDGIDWNNFILRIVNYHN